MVVNFEAKKLKINVRDGNQLVMNPPETLYFRELFVISRTYFLVPKIPNLLKNGVTIHLDNRFA